MAQIEPIIKIDASNEYFDLFTESILGIMVPTDSYAQFFSLPQLEVTKLKSKVKKHQFKAKKFSLEFQKIKKQESNSIDSDDLHYSRIQLEGDNLKIGESSSKAKDQNLELWSVSDPKPLVKKMLADVSAQRPQVFISGNSSRNMASEYNGNAEDMGNSNSSASYDYGQTIRSINNYRSASTNRSEAVSVESKPADTPTPTSLPSPGEQAFAVAGIAANK